MSSFQDAMARKRALIDAAKAKAAPSTEISVRKEVEKIHPKDAVNKLGIIFDNSGSMHGSKIKNAKAGVVEFLRNCTLNKDAVGVFLLEVPTYGEKLGSLVQNAILTTDLVALASEVDSPNLTDLGSTPLFTTIKKALSNEIRLTRLIAFSDGSPDYADACKQEEVLALAKKQGVTIDTVFFGSEFESGARLMKEIAEVTGGIYLVFDPIKGCNFAQSFKYLSPGKRLMLMDENFKAKLERGEV